MEPEALLTPAELAHYLGVPTATLTRWRYVRSGPSFLRVGRHVRYAWWDVQEWIRSVRQEGEGDELAALRTVEFPGVRAHATRGRHP
ncbi:MAG: helix-turn-helix domain-containing protein [Actinomycetota bacterium]